MIYPFISELIFLIFISIPIISTLILYFICKQITKYRWKAIHLSVQISVIFYIIAVILLVEKVLKQNVLWIILIVLISLLAVILIIQCRMKTEVSMRNGLKILARISFLLFGILYLLLITYEIAQFVIINYT